MTTTEYKGYVIKTEYDECAESPREWDNVGTMICFHDRYNLGDKTSLKSRDFDSWEELEAYIKEEYNPMVIMPIRGYDHGGMVLSLSNGYPFNDVWDSGMVGFMFTTQERAIELWGTEVTEAQIIDAFKSEIDTYNMWACGDVWIYTIEDSHENHIDSCGGYFGEADCIESAQHTVDYLVEKQNEQFSKISSPIGLYAFIAGGDE